MVYFRTLIKTSFPVDLKNTEMSLISIQSLALTERSRYFRWFIVVVAAILFKNNLSSFHQWQWQWQGQ